MQLVHEIQAAQMKNYKAKSKRRINQSFGQKYKIIQQCNECNIGKFNMESIKQK